MPPVSQLIILLESDLDIVPRQPGRRKKKRGERKRKKGSEQCRGRSTEGFLRCDNSAHQLTLFAGRLTFSAEDKGKKKEKRTLAYRKFRRCRYRKLLAAYRLTVAPRISRADRTGGGGKKKERDSPNRSAEPIYHLATSVTPSAEKKGKKRRGADDS